MINQMSKVIIIGMGNIGKRHLEAASNIEPAVDLICADINSQAIESTKEFIIKNNLKTRRIDFYENINESISQIDSESVVIDATTADTRKDLLKKIIMKKPKGIITEKPLVQNASDYQEIIKASSEEGIPVYVNFARHLFPSYHNLCNEIQKDLDENAAFYGHFSKIGMACNGIHIIELVTWLFNAKTYSIIDSQVTSEYETKRKGFFDFTGSIHIRLDGKKTAVINILDKQTLDCIQIINRKSHIILEQKQKIITVNEQGIETSDFKILFVSQVIDKVIMDILEKRQPQLPHINQTLMSHSILFDIMKKHNLSLNFT